jgi:hypothetical protein
VVASEKIKLIGYRGQMNTCSPSQLAVNDALNDVKNKLMRTSFCYMLRHRGNLKELKREAMVFKHNTAKLN